MIADTLHRPLRDLRISVTDRCNFRCTYCMPAQGYGADYQFLPRHELLTFEEITRLTRLITGLGVNKIRLTGGEPLLRRAIERLVVQLAGSEGVEDLALTTNGVLLAQKAQALKDAGLQRVNVSLDSLDEVVFRHMNGNRSDVQTVLTGIEAAERAGFAPIKINTVVQRGVNDHTVVDLARYCKDRGYIARFIEYMDAGNLNGWQPADVVPADAIVAMIHADMPLEPIESTYRSEVAARYRYRDGSGEIGIIASVTKPFCGNCTRLRLSPQGSLYTCLFATAGTDLRGLLRAGATDEEIARIVRRVWTSRVDRYSEIRASLPKPPEYKVEMYQIGG